jgi:thioredoxin-related protein
VSIALKLFITLFVSCCLASAHAEGTGKGLTTGLENPGYLDKPAWFKESFLDLREDVAEATAAGKRLLLYFYQDGCPYCAKLLQDNFADRKIADSTRDHFDVLAINMWGDKAVTGLDGREITEKQFASKMRVQFTPSLVFLDEQARVAMRINGYFPPHKFKAALDYVAGKHEKNQKFSAFLAAREPQQASGKVQHEPIFLSEPMKLGENRQSSYRPLMVIFEQAECASCDELHQESLRRQSLVTALSNLDVAQLDMRSSDMLQTPDGSNMPVHQWVQSLGIQYAPSMVFFDGKGKEVFRVEAYLKSFHLHAAIDYVVTAAYLHQPNFQRFIQHRADALHAAGFEFDLMQ